MSRKSELPLLTQFELEVMSIIWRMGEGTVRDVLNQLPSERKVAYTSVATIIKILEEKNFISSIKMGKVHTFVPRLQQETYQKKTLQHIVEQLFNGVTSELVRNLIKNEVISEEEKKEIKRLVDQL